MPAPAAIAAGIIQVTPYVLELLQTAIHGLTIAQKGDSLTVEDLEAFRDRALASEKKLDAAIQAAIDAKKAE